MDDRDMNPILTVDDLKTYFFLKRGIVKAVDGVSFTIRPREIVGLVGESGCGKSMTALSILRLVPYPSARIVDGSILFKGENILEKSDREMRAVRGKGISMIPQDPMVSLDPVFTIGRQVAEAFSVHPNEGNSGERIAEKVLGVLRRVRIPSPEWRIKNYPHQFSGGMRQRVLAAIAVSCQPELLIADEPTTALDVTVQAQFLSLLAEIISESRTSVIYITHDLGVVAQLCDRVLVMYAGKIVESGSVTDIFKEPAHPYTAGLIQSVPRLDEERETLYQVEGQPPDLGDLPRGCSFRPRCDRAMKICREEYPSRHQLDGDRWAACWLYSGKKST
jgi:peptide/nickel transport system ATP-binding protein/oligopeptide transport system ATP-binding protein